ncbi:MAG: S8 family peptidase, partial [bacterium]|nr:S8 family peptidase [Candidatus Kapabacteria bacterium]
SYIGGDSSSTASNNGTGSVTGVNVYVIDTGIDPSHDDLNVVGGINYGDVTIDSNNYADANGHGTHVAGTIAALDNGMYTVGVAPGAPLYSVRVFNSRGAGTIQMVMKGIEWVKRHFAANGGPAVANMSMSSTASWTFDQSTSSLVSAGVTVVVAAGNETKLASLRSPGRIPAVITVGATSSSSAYAGFANYGSSVDILAPGVDVLSTAMGGGVATKSGTSMAAPHVAGAAVLYLNANTTKTPAQVATALVGTTVSWGTSLPTGTPNKMCRVNGY